VDKLAMRAVDLAPLLEDGHDRRPLGGQQAAHGMAARRSVDQPVALLARPQCQARLSLSSRALQQRRWSQPSFTLDALGPMEIPPFAEQRQRSLAYARDSWSRSEPRSRSGHGDGEGRSSVEPRPAARRNADAPASMAAVDGVAETTLTGAR
jgi:hypothetical protein